MNVMACIFALGIENWLWWSYKGHLACWPICITGLYEATVLWFIDESVKTRIHLSCSSLNLSEDVIIKSITWCHQERILTFHIWNVTLLLVEYQVICEEVGESFEQVNLLIELLHRFVVRLSLHFDLSPLLFCLSLDNFDLFLQLLTLSSDIQLFFNVLFDYRRILVVKVLKLVIEGLLFSLFSNLQLVHTFEHILRESLASFVIITINTFRWSISGRCWFWSIRKSDVTRILL